MYVEVRREVFFGTRSHAKGDVVMVTEDKGADLIKEGFAIPCDGPERLAEPVPVEQAPPPKKAKKVAETADLSSQLAAAEKALEVS